MKGPVGDIRPGLKNRTSTSDTIFGFRELISRICSVEIVEQFREMYALSIVNVVVPSDGDEMGIPKSEEDESVVFEGTVYQPSESGSVILVREARNGILI